MNTRSAAKRTRGRREDEEFLSLKIIRRRKLVPVRAPPVWKRSLVYRGPTALHSFGTATSIPVDEFVEHCSEVVRLSKAVLACRFPKETPFLPPKLRGHSDRKTLVLDIDETLVHSEAELQPGVEYDATFRVEHMGTSKTIGMTKRPYVKEFLAWCGENFEVVTFTSAIKPYADQVLKLLDPEGEHVKYRLYREHCTICNQDVYFKNLDHLRRDLSKTLIVDNSPFAFAYHLENGIPIESFYAGESGKDDQELLKLKNFLEEVMKAEDVREVIKGKFRMRSFLGFISTCVSTSEEDA